MNTASTLALTPDDDSDAPLRAQQAEAARLARCAGWVLGLGVLPLAAWLTLAPLASAVVAPAFVKVDLERRPVQHAEGGTVRQVLVRDGQRVQAGEALMVLGDVSVDADMNRLTYRVAAEQASVARLEAEQAFAPALRWPEELSAVAGSDPRVAEQLTKEQALFSARRSALLSQTALLRAQQDKLAQEREALAAQIEQATESLRHQTAELETHRGLLKDGYISATRISQLEATVADYGVKLAERRGELARAGQRLIDNDLRIKSLESEYRQQASDQLKVTSARLSEIQQEQRKTSDASQRQVIVAPAAGEVMNLRFMSPGAVVSPREPIAEIVPSDARLMVEARIRTEDVARVHQGQRAEIRFTAFKARSTRLVVGNVAYVAPDRNVDRQSGNAYYVATVQADPASLAEAGDLRLQAGMPAEVYFNGEQRTALQYLLEPLTQVMRRAGREQ
jgi:HlyD family type I secretion membrane fusion protein